MFLKIYGHLLGATVAERIDARHTNLKDVL